MLSPVCCHPPAHADQQLKMRAGAGKLGWVLPLLAFPTGGQDQAHTWRPAGAGAPLPLTPLLPAVLGEVS